MGERALRGIANSLPAKRVGTPEDIADAVVMLMTNPFLTGEILHVDGGARIA